MMFNKYTKKKLPRSVTRCSQQFIFYDFFLLRSYDRNKHQRVAEELRAFRYQTFLAEFHATRWPRRIARRAIAVKYQEMRTNFLGQKAEKLPEIEWVVCHFVNENGCSTPCCQLRLLVFVLMIRVQIYLCLKHKVFLDVPLVFNKTHVMYQ